MTWTDPITIHRAALAPLQRDFLAFREPPMPDWIERTAPNCFVRLYVCDAQNPHILVPAARWAAAGADVLLREEQPE